VPVDVKKTIIMSDIPIMVLEDDDDSDAEGIDMLLMSILTVRSLSLCLFVSLCPEDDSRWQ
jgi:hypothetical protein